MIGELCAYALWTWSLQLKMSFTSIPFTSFPFVHSIVSDCAFERRAKRDLILEDWEYYQATWGVGVLTNPPILQAKLAHFAMLCLLRVWHRLHLSILELPTLKVLKITITLLRPNFRLKDVTYIDFYMTRNLAQSTDQPAHHLVTFCSCYICHARNRNMKMGAPSLEPITLVSPRW